jgi:ABC-type lipoprotein release transport system permease subunit
MNQLTQHVRYALRTLLRTPGPAAAAILSLAIGIGANSALFSVVNGLLLKPLPYPDPDFALTRVMTNLLFDVSPSDLTTFASVPVVLSAVALAASYIPARRATRIEPLVALRDE